MRRLKKLVSSKSRGFTLIELLVVITIIAILAIAIFVAMGRARKAARDSQRRSFCHDVVTAQELYYQANDAYATSIDDLRADNYIKQDRVVCPETPKMDCSVSDWGSGGHWSSDGSIWWIKTKLESSDKTFTCNQNGCKEE